MAFHRRCLSLIIRAMIRLFLRCPSATKCNRSNPSRKGYHAMLTNVFSPCLVRLKINFSGIPVISSLYILWAGRICPCVRRTWVVPSTHRRRATEVQTRTPPYGHVAGGTANARWRYHEGTVPVRWTCLRYGIFCMRFGASGARRPQRDVRWLQNNFQTPISRRRRRIWDVTPPQHQTRKSRSTCGGLWPRHYIRIGHETHLTEDISIAIQITPKSK